MVSYEVFLTFFIGFIVGFLMHRSKEDKEQTRIYEERYKEYDDKLQYYKKLTRNLSEENNNLRQWERRYLDVIESLSIENKPALNSELRTYDGKLK